ncbi:hypothetical protein M1466_01880 [Candidatus Dependentiae bacterium]|nr:hypothetical protein [Candidatus Dependentiae bacterium]
MRLLCTLLYSIVVMLLVMPRPTEAMQAAISSLSEQEEALFLSAVETSNYSLVQQFAPRASAEQLQAAMSLVRDDNAIILCCLLEVGEYGVFQQHSFRRLFSIGF